MDFMLAGAAACGACLFTNPLEVVKTRMQLQGELKRWGSYRLHYRNVFHATYTIWKVDGLLALQKGLLPALLYQFCMNGIRLGSYALMETSGYTLSDGKISGAKSTVAGALAGVTGALLASPIYLGMLHALTTIYRRHGFTGLWRGSSSAVPRVIVGSASQLSTFSKTKQITNDLQVFKPGSWLVSLTAGMVSSVFVVLAMTPFDVVSTRLYNQPVDRQGKGTFYRGYLDCFSKTMRKEGLFGLYKGAGASYFRLGPHTILSLLFWEELRKFYWQ
ncbi:solute carrier family 25 member 35 isoform X1 [Heterodontus francisci]|uniref:solute carrier family 25 member 35 isoform X1 n=1 Tax=Heterodontus francisci TaxID=7792 RepID=UPI00355BD8E7